MIGVRELFSGLKRVRDLVGDLRGVSGLVSSLKAFRRRKRAKYHFNLKVFNLLCGRTYIQGVVNKLSSKYSEITEAL